MGKKILGIIPARGGSKGVKNKNIVDIAGKPLLQYTAEPALEIADKGLIDHLILSTDSTDIATIGRKIGLDVPFLRPAKYATDSSKSIDLVLHALGEFKKQQKTFDAILLLQPTSPLRSAKDIEGSINLFDKKDAKSLISVCKVALEDFRLYRKDGDIGRPLNPIHNTGICRQDLEQVYRRNGAIFISNSIFAQEHYKLISDTPLLFEMPEERSIDINSEDDLWYCRWKLKKDS